jgi:structural maintenance of chromosome 4
LGQIDAFDNQVSESSKKLHHWNAEISKVRAAAEDDDDMDLSDDEEEEEDLPSINAKDAEGDVEMEEGETAPKRKDRATKSSLPTLSFAALEKYDKDEIKEEITFLETERNTIAKNANMGAIAEYRKKEVDYLAR